MFTTNRPLCRLLTTLCLIALLIATFSACTTTKDPSAESTATESGTNATESETALESETASETESDTTETESDSTENETDPVDGETDAALDYADTANWAYYAEGEGKEADLFLICPTVDMGKNGECNMSMDNAKVKSNFLGALNMERGIYEDVATMYAPYYRQMTFPTVTMSAEEAQPYFDIAYRDVAAAFEYYFEHCNNGRPIILAGFSQGSQMLLALMKEYFDDPTYSDRLVAAYCIGWTVTEEEVKQFPQLRMAQGEDDTGVIISFNSEAEGIEESIIVPQGVKTLGINPLNWKTDSTPADRSLNQGACFTNYSGEITQEIAQMTGAYLDAERGTLRVTDVDPKEYTTSLFPEGVYHMYDYQFFFRNLQSNVAVRLEAFLTADNA